MIRNRFHRIFVPVALIALTHFLAVIPSEASLRDIDPGETVAETAVFQQHMRKFVSDMFNYNARETSDMKKRFGRVASGMSPQTAGHWSEWILKWMPRAKAARALSELQAMNVFVSKKNSEIFVRIPAVQRSMMFGKQSVENTTIFIRLKKFRDGYLIDSVTQETPAKQPGERNGYFSVDSSGVHTESTMESSEIDSMVRESIFLPESTLSGN